MEMEKLHHLQENAEVGVAVGAQHKSNFPPQLTRRYEVYLTLPPAEKLSKMRAVTSAHLGALVKLKVWPEVWQVWQVPQQSGQQMEQRHTG